MGKPAAVLAFTVITIIVCIGFLVATFMRRQRKIKDEAAFHLTNRADAPARPLRSSDLESLMTETSYGTMFSKGSRSTTSSPAASLPKTPPPVRTSVHGRVGAMRQHFRLPAPSSVYSQHPYGEARFVEAPKGEPGGRESLWPSYMTPPPSDSGGRSPRFVEHLDDDDGQFEEVELGQPEKRNVDARDIEMQRTKVGNPGARRETRWSTFFSGVNRNTKAGRGHVRS
ncbi:MAG: hypothetical protein M1828_001888 [Chrysothrix sp. TS-e1954]|nr:MAG: hypothetical protein M1828_001888 [Chrysothrix sp. TS-e1954]